MGKQVTDYLLYRWRYVLGYGLIGLTIVGLLTLAGLYVPGGLSQDEMQSVVKSESLTLSLAAFDPASVINLPYHLLQRVSIDLFGLSTVSIKLPSLILGLLSALGMLILLRTWFKENVAAITSILVITTGQFLFIAQSGTESIIYIFWPIWILVAAMMVSRKAKWSGLWKIVLCSIAALGLYTPLSAYILLALLSAVVLHPHLRYLVRRLPKPKMLLAGFFALIILSPLIYAIVLDSSIALALLGIPGTWPDFQANALQLARQYFDFLTPDHGTLMTPIYGLGSMILILLGIMRLVTTKYTARSYIITAWGLLLLPVLVINPGYVSITFVPVVLLMAMGINALLGNWYMLFPRNPYARLAGLIPLAILIGGMVLSGVDRYVYGYLYAPHTASNFSQDLRLINDQLEQQNGSTTLVTSKEENGFYSSVVRQHSDTITTTSAPDIKDASGTVIFSRSAHKSHHPTVPPDYIVTDSTTKEADRFYIYKTDNE